jgi:hypothetical protein
MKYKRIEGHEGYLIYKNGDVVSLLRSKPVKLKHIISRSGSIIVSLHSSMNRWMLVAELLASAFIGKCPKGHHVYHKDLDQKNISISNLHYIPIEQYRAIRMLEKSNQLSKNSSLHVQKTKYGSWSARIRTGAKNYNLIVHESEIIAASVYRLALIYVSQAKFAEFLDILSNAKRHLTIRDYSHANCREFILAAIEIARKKGRLTSFNKYLISYGWKNKSFKGAK